MTAYPGYVRLSRLLGQGDLLRWISRAGEAAPERLDSENLAMLRSLVDAGLERIAAGLSEEAAASDDVSDHDSALLFVQARIAEFGDLLSEEQARRLLTAVERLIAGWG